jgi:phage repressor protein C with HTH and peptisase S24 domain
MNGSIRLKRDTLFMPGTTSEFSSDQLISSHAARYRLVTVELPGRDEFAAGVLLEDPEANRLYLRLRRDWHHIAPEEAEVLELLEGDLAGKASQMGAADFLANCEDTFSNTVGITESREIMVETFERALGRLYRQHVKSEVREFVTHLPRYSLAAAAGAFLENPTVECREWDEAPSGLRLTKEMFVAQVVGRSMLPLIPDGALCVFRHGVTGTRQGRLVLVEAEGANDRYTVKRYRSEKMTSAEGTWAHQRIRLEPLNPEFEAWDLDPEENRYRILAEFVQTLD